MARMICECGCPLGDHLAPTDRDPAIDQVQGQDFSQPCRNCDDCKGFHPVQLEFYEEQLPTKTVMLSSGSKVALPSHLASLIDNNTPLAHAQSTAKPRVVVRDMGGVVATLEQDPRALQHAEDTVERESAQEPASTSASTINHPSYYGGDTTYEAIKVIEAWGLDFCLGSTVKYLSRAGKKDPTKELEDLEKAAWYLNRRIEQLKR